MTSPQHVFTTARRYYLAKRIEAAELGDISLQQFWQGKQEAEAGTLLGAGFPSYSELAAVGYVAQEDLAGADIAELMHTAGLTRRRAAAVFAALPSE